eukprot:scaffold78001_cov41-Cyclotella_meneghiniana.AAC.4
MEIGDPLGTSLAVEMEQYSITAKGRIAKLIQFETTRKHHSTWTRAYDSPPQGILGCVILYSRDSKSSFHIRPRSVRMVDASQHTSIYERTLLKFGAYIAILTAASLRGHEGFFLDLAATRNLLQKGKSGVVPEKFNSNKVLSEEDIENLPYITICLLGKFKGETGERYHSIVLASETMSRLEVRWWVEQLLETAVTSGHHAEYNALFRQYLQRIQLDSPKQFAPEEDVTRYGINPTLRKTAVSRAGRAGLSGDVRIR